MSNVDSKGARPRYKLTEAAYINDILYDRNQGDMSDPHFGEVDTDHDVVPGPHMIPLNEAAKTQAKKMVVGQHPINSMPLLGNGDPEDAQKRLVDSLVAALAKILPQAGAVAPSAPGQSPEEIEDRIQEALAKQRNELQAQFDKQLDELTGSQVDDGEKAENDEAA